MLEWMGLVFAICVVLGFVILVKCRKEQVGIAVVAAVIAIISTVGAVYCFIGYGCGVDVKLALDEGGTYFVKSATYYNEGDGVRLDFQEIDVATNETIGPEFLYWRAVGVSEAPTVVKNGDIMIYQNGKMRHWVSPF